MPTPRAGTYSWTTLLRLTLEVQWNSSTSQKEALSFRNDPNPMMLTGQGEYAGRKFSMTASESATDVKTLTFDEKETDPRDDHVLGEVYKGVAGAAIQPRRPVRTT